jgi:hypothetical protein
MTVSARVPRAPVTSVHATGHDTTRPGRPNNEQLRRVTEPVPPQYGFSSAEAGFGAGLGVGAGLGGTAGGAGTADFGDWPDFGVAAAATAVGCALDFFFLAGSACESAVNVATDADADGVGCKAAASALAKGSVPATDRANSGCRASSCSTSGPTLSGSLRGGICS